MAMNPGDTKRYSGLNAIPQWSIEHPYMILAFYTAVVVMAVIVVGFTMPRRFMPYVESPVVGVFTMMPGLSAKEMEMYITKPIEEQMTNIRDLHYLRSSSQDGFSVVSLEFYYGTDMKKALFDVQSLMNIVQASLPPTGANLKPSWVLAIDPLNMPVISLSLTGKGWDPVRLRQFADNTVVSRLKQRVPDVYSVVSFGGYRRELQVLVNRNKLAAYHLSILDVRNAIDQYNVSRAAGTLTWKGDESIVRLDTRARDAKTVANYPVTSVAPPGRKGLGQAQSPRIVRIKDVARVVDSYWERRSAFHFVKHLPGTKGEIIPSIQVSIIQNPEASSWKVIRDCWAVLHELEHEYPGIKFEAAYDNSHFINVLFHNMIEELGIAVLMCGIAVFLFLGEWRGTLISITAMPLSLAMAIICLVPLGMTLNSGTLIGLVLSIGRLVDDTIIDVHACERYLRMGKSPKEAAIVGIGEVRRAVIASTLIIVLALAPLLFCGGVVQLMFVELVWPLIFALLASMVVSFTLTSLMAAHILRPESERAAEQKTWFFVHFLNPFQVFLHETEVAYRRSIDWMLQHSSIILMGIAATAIIGFGFYYFIGSEMMPLADVGQAYGVLEMAPGTSFAATERAATQIERIMLTYPEIQRVSTKIGSESMLESTGTYFTGYAVPMANSATFLITLSDMSERKRTIWDVIDGVQAKAMKTIPGIRRLQIKEMGSDVMATSQAPIALIVYGPNLSILNKLGQQLLQIAKEKHVYQAATDWTMGEPTYQIHVDEGRARQLGLTVNSIAAQAYYALHGGFTNEFYRLPNIRQNMILVRYDQKGRESENDLAHTYITTPDGRQIPLNAVATIEKTVTPTVIPHDGLRRVITVLGFYRRQGKPSMDLTMDVQMAAMSKLNFPPGYGIEARGDMTEMMDSFRRLLGGLGLALLFIFLVLVAEFRGYIQPLQMVLALPLELSGVFVGLYIAHQAFSTVSMLGIIVLTGMNATTGILLVDMIMTYRDRGVSRDEAVRLACPERLRPILMTSIITIIAMVPVAFFPKTGMDAYSAIGTVVIGGLVMGTILTLFAIPILHVYVDEAMKIIYRVFLHREWEWPIPEYMDEEEGAPPVA